MDGWTVTFSAVEAAKTIDDVATEFELRLRENPEFQVLRRSEPDATPSKGIIHEAAGGLAVASVSIFATLKNEQVAAVIQQLAEALAVRIRTPTRVTLDITKIDGTDETVIHIDGEGSAGAIAKVLEEGLKDFGRGDTSD